VCVCDVFIPTGHKYTLNSTAKPCLVLDSNPLECICLHVTNNQTKLQVDVPLVYILYRSVMYCISNCIYFRQHNFCIDTLCVSYLLYVSAFRPLHVCTVTVGTTARPSQWPMFAVGMLCVVRLLCCHMHSC
jgi:hypothetical protein